MLKLNQKKVKELKTTTKRHFKLFELTGIFSAFLLMSSVIVYVFFPSLGLKASESSQTIGPYSMSMSMNSNVQINATPTPTQAEFSGLNNISVTNTCTSGATISLTSRTTTNDLVNTQSNSNKISATTTNTLENNTWGFSKDGGTTWSGVPKSNSTAYTLYDASTSQDTATNVSVLYGVKIDSSILSGSYTNDVVYTMLPKSGCSSYNVTWNQNGGTANPTGTYPTTMSWEQNIDLSTITPTRNGYNFAGWSNGTTTFPTTSGATNINPDNTQSLTMTALWTPVNYTISYNLAGGTVSPANPTSYTIETETFTLRAPTLSGYEFIGWTGSNGTTPQETVTITKGSTGNREYVANFTLPNFNITYDLAGGTVSPANPTRYNAGTPTFTLTNPTKPGYTFTGWTGSNGTTPQTTVTIEQGSTGAKSYTANWTLATYDITYELNGGSVATANPTTYNINTETFTLTNPTKNGYTFTGWSGTGLTGTDNTSVSVTKGSYGNRTYTANWTPINYTITYNLNGGSATNPTSYNINTDTFTLTNPTKNYYTFAGWSGTGLTGSANTSVSIAKGSTGNREYTANWTPVSYTISYDLSCTNATNGSGNPTSYTYESNAITLAAPSCPGYTFTGWTGSNGTTAQTSVTISKNSSGNRSYTANWSLDTYTISYTLNGGSANNPATYNINTDTFTLTNPTRNGYTFAGWNGTGLTGSANTSVSVAKGSTGNRSYTANWTPTNYTISYTLNGGSVSPANPTSYNITTETFSLNNPTRNGYTFTGWTGSNGTTAQTSVSVTKGSTGNRTYTANWTPVNYSITYTWNGGSCTSPKTSYTIETNTFSLCTPTRSGYTFTGWTGSNGSTAQTSVSIAKGSTGNKSYTANWSLNTYTISYTLNGGTVSSANPTTYNVTTNTFTLNNPTRNGYTFVGWSGTGLTGNNNTSVSVAKGSTGNREYTANWSAVSYTISYTWNGGSCSSPKTSYTIETDTFSLCTPTRTGYTFTGWTGSNGSTAQTSVSISKGSTGNKSYTANWSLTNYSISYTLGCTNATNGSGNPTSYTYESNAITLAAPSCPGHTFTGWTGSNGSTAQTSVTIAKNSTGNKSYTANWSVINYSISYTLNGGTVSTANPTSYNINTNTFTLNNPTKSYYTFNGWSGTGLTGTNNTSVSVAKGSTGDRSYTANFTPTSYSISYPLGCTGATNPSSNPTSYTYESNAITLAAPSCPGYTFTGWTGSNGTTAQTSVTIPKNSNGNKSYTANWSVINYSISYTWNGGSCSSPKTSYTIDTATFSLCTPTRTGYTFTGWTGSNGNTAQTSVSIAKGSTGNKSYTANWTIKRFTVTTNGNFDSANSGTKTKTVDYGTSVTAYKPTSGLNSCTWSGYSTSGDVQTDTYYCYSWDQASPWTKTITDDTTMNYTQSSYATGDYRYRYAQKFYNSGSLYTIVWTDSDGSGYFYAPSAPSAPVGYAFGSWYAADNSGYLEPGARYKNTTSKSYNARWNAISYTISYDFDGGSCSSYPTSYTIATDTFSLCTPTRTGYTFAGWSGTGLSGSNNLSVTIVKGSNGNRSYTAHWNAINYVVEVVNGSFSDGSTSKTLHYGDTATIKAAYDGVGSISATVSGATILTQTVYYKNNSITDWDNSNPCNINTIQQTRSKYYNRTYFSEWNDGNSSADRTITVTGAARYTASFISESELYNPSGAATFEFSPSKVYQTQTCREGSSNWGNTVYYAFGYENASNARLHKGGPFNDGSNWSETYKLGDIAYATSYTASTRALHAYKNNSSGTTGTTNFRKHIYVSDAEIPVTSGSGTSIGWTLCDTNNVNCYAYIASEHTDLDKNHQITITVPHKFEWL